MADLKEVFSRIKDTKQKQKEIRRMYKDALAQNMEYGKLIEQLDQMKARKKEIENDIKHEMEADIQKLDAYRMHIKTDQEMMSDLAINQLMSGETVELVDENDQKYEPVFSVRFKKV